MAQKIDRKLWIEPIVRVLEIEETHASSGQGADVGGNAFLDSQRS